MSDFLINLVRRGAGLDPVIAARRAPFAGNAVAGEPALEMVEDGPAVQAARRPEPPRVIERSGEGTAPVPQADPVAAPAMRPQTAVAVIQRAMRTEPAAEAASGTTPMMAASNLREPSRPGQVSSQLPQSLLRGNAEMASPALVRATAEGDETPAAAAVLRTLPEDAATPSRRAGQASMETVAAQQERSTVLQSAAPAPASRVPFDEKPRVVESKRPTANSSGAAAAIPRATAATEAPPVPERIVQVRIGAIEIRAEPATAATAPPPAAPRPAPTAPAGFESFAALRSYASWSW